MEKSEDMKDLSLQERASKVEEQFIGNSAIDRQESQITRICLTGGPCAGKTTALAELTLVLN